MRRAAVVVSVAVSLGACGGGTPATSHVDASIADQLQPDRVATAREAALDSPSRDRGVGADAFPARDLLRIDSLRADTLAGAPDARVLVIGAACTADADCPGGTCAIAASDWPGGYCTKACAAGGDCPGAAECVIGAGQTSGFCLATCASASGCRAGYLCGDTFLTTPLAAKACFPGNAAASLGSACSSFADCNNGQFCVTDPAFPGGYCSAPCTSAKPCAGGGLCGAIDATTGQGLCFETCGGTGVSCRSGYACVDRFGGTSTAATICVPGKPGTATGSPCTTLADCAPGGYCLSEAATGFPGGYCSDGCGTAATGSCPDGTDVCTVGAGSTTAGSCLRSCSTGAACSSGGYSCSTDFFGQTLAANACVPGTSTGAPVGGACANDGGCRLGELCLPASDGYTGGYCSQSCNTATTPGGGCPSGAACVDGDTPGPGYCFQTCAGSCARAGYGCTTRLAGGQASTSGRAICEPYDAAATVGSACTSYTACPLGGACLTSNASTGASWPNGYCSDVCAGGSSPAPCASGSYCQPVSTTLSICLETCTSSTMCRTSDGYSCKPITTGAPDACLP